MEEARFSSTRALSQYYRDALSLFFRFPHPGVLPADIVSWAVQSRSIDQAQLTEKLLACPPAGITPQEELALKLALVTIFQANLFLNAEDAPHRAQDIINAIHGSLHRILTLDPDMAYMEIAVQLLFRIGEVGHAVDLAERHPEAIAGSAVISVILGFVYTMEGEWERALQYLKPVASHPSFRELPMVDLCMMTCDYHRRERPAWPVRFDTLEHEGFTLEQGLATLPAFRIDESAVPREGAPVFMAACDSRYFFEHFLMLACSLHAVDPHAALHVHLYAPNASVHAALAELRAALPGLSLGVSQEEPYKGREPKIYYSAARFARLHQLLAHYGHPLCMVDADALFNRSWREFAAPDAPLVLSAGENVPFWERVTAGFIYARPEPEAMRFVEAASRFILFNFLHGNVVWFLDQIALSLCDDRLGRPRSGVAYLPPRRLTDVVHGDEALLWAVTNDKYGRPRYNARREALGAKYGLLPQAYPALVFQHLSQEPVFFLQVGAMDGMVDDPIQHFVKAHGWRGILVEPLPDMMARLKANYAGQEGLVFENVAVTEQTETRTLYRVTAEAAARANLPPWVAGMSTFVPGKLDEFQPHVTEQPVSCLPLSALLAKHNPPRIDVLQIDTEGYDYTVLKQFDFARWKPRVVNMEFVNLSAEEKAQAQALLHAQGYLFFEHELDLFAVHQDVLFR